MITIKSDSEIRQMAKAGKITATALDAVRKAVRPGVSTLELDEIAKDVILSLNAVPAFYNYNGFPGNICVSINDEIVHGIPSAGRVLREGDIVSIDIGATYGGFVGDMADTYPVGRVSEEATALIETTRAAFYAGLAFCAEGMRLYDVSHAIQTQAESKGYGVVRDYVGHGIGRNMHEDPSVPNYGEPGKGVRLQNGMTLAIEPMVNIGGWETVLADDNWTVKTADGSLSAHYEHTVALTESGPVLLTVM